MSIIDKARAFIANHTVEPRYGAVDEMVRGLIEHIDEQAALLRAKDAALEVVKDRADTWSRTASEVMEERDEALAMVDAAMREGLSECERLREQILVANAAGKFLDHHAKGVRADLREARDRLRVAEETIEDPHRSINASLSDSASQGWTPATVCEACKGDEVSGCICGMVPGTEPRRKP